MPTIIKVAFVRMSQLNWRRARSDEFATRLYSIRVVSPTSLSRCEELDARRLLSESIGICLQVYLYNYDILLRYAPK